MFTSTIPINSNGNAFQTIQEAVDDEGSDGWVYVPEGIWEGVDLNIDDISLFGNGWSSIISGQGSDYAINIQGDRVQIYNLQVKTTSGGVGRHAIRTETTASHLIIDNVYVSQADNAGIELNGPYTWIKNSYIADTDWAGVAIYGDNCLVTNNRFNDDIGGDLVYVAAGANNSTVTGNHANGYPAEPIDNDSGETIVTYSNSGFDLKSYGTGEASNDDWIVHNLYAAPTYIQVTVIESDSAYSCQVKAVNGTKFQVYLYDIVAAGAEDVDKTIDWIAYYDP